MNTDVRSVIATTTLNTLVLPSGTNSDWTVRRPSSSRQDHTLCGCLVLQGSHRRKAEAGGDIEPSDPRGIPTPSKPEATRVVTTPYPSGLRPENAWGIRNPVDERQRPLPAVALYQDGESSGDSGRGAKSTLCSVGRKPNVCWELPCLASAARSPVMVRSPGSVTLVALVVHPLNPSCTGGDKGWMISRSCPPSLLHPLEPLSGLPLHQTYEN